MQKRSKLRGHVTTSIIGSARDSSHYLIAISLKRTEAGFKGKSRDGKKGHRSEYGYLILSQVFGQSNDFRKGISDSSSKVNSATGKDTSSYKR